MATVSVGVSEDRIPLLSEAEESLPAEIQGLQEEFERQYPLRTPPQDARAADAPTSGHQRGSSRRKHHYSGNEMIVSVFVVAFDTKKGRGSEQLRRMRRGRQLALSQTRSCSIHIYSHMHSSDHSNIAHSPLPSGNIVEWKYPPEVNLEGVEFKSLASGLHHVTKDFM